MTSAAAEAACAGVCVGRGGCCPVEPITPSSPSRSSPLVLVCCAPPPGYSTRGSALMTLISTASKKRSRVDIRKGEAECDRASQRLLEVLKTVTLLRRIDFFVFLLFLLFSLSFSQNAAGLQLTAIPEMARAAAPVRRVCSSSSRRRLFDISQGGGATAVGAAPI